MAQYTLDKGVLVLLESSQDKAKERIDSVRSRLEDRPDWMKVTDNLNASREARLLQLLIDRPDLYAARQVHILSEDLSY